MASDLTRSPEYQHTMRRLKAAKRTTEQGVSYWRAREIMPLLGYVEWDNFLKIIEKGREALRNNKEDPSQHILEITAMLGVGNNATREGADYILSKPACYLIAMNGQPSKPEIAAAQAYFFVQTRRMEDADQLANDLERCELRDKATEVFKRLSGTAQQAGVRNHMQPVFHDAGYRGMYAMPRKDVLQAKGLKQGDNLLDYAGTLELAANAFRMELADDVLKRERIRSEREAILRHESVGREVRDTIERSRGTLPEALPIEPHIKEARNRVDPPPAPRGKLKKPE